MKILLYGLNFAPEPTGIGKYTGELAKWLAASNHEVRAVTGFPYYPDWKISAEYVGRSYASERWHGVDVQRVPLWVPKEPTGIKRVLHLLSFALLSIPTLIAEARRRPDVICIVAPAFACAPGAWLAARACGAKAWLHVQDFEVDAAFKMGLLKGRTSQRLIGAVERWLFQRFDRVSTISNRMLERLMLKGVKAERIVSFPNWVDMDTLAPHASAGAYRAELGIPDDAVVALYSGSMAGKQGLELLPTVARRMQATRPDLFFVLCGNGVCKAGLERDCEGLSNVRMLPLQPAERLGELLCMADIHLLPQHADAADLVMPSKLTGMLASGRPVVATARTGTELATVVQGRGIVVAPDDAPGFEAALASLVDSAPRRHELGAAARRYAEDHLARDRVLSNFEEALRLCIAKTAGDSKPARRVSSVAEKFPGNPV